VCWGQESNINPSAALFDTLESTPMTQARFNFDVGCIIRSDGTAACYQSQFGQQAIAEFSNGPYKSIFPLANNNPPAWAACALTFDNKLDCVETVISTDDVPLPLTVTRLFDTYKSVQADFRNLVGLTFENKLVSITNETNGGSNSTTIAIVNGELEMTAIDRFPGNYRRQFDTQIFRDGELLTVTDNYGSYLDRTATTQAQYTYELRAVHTFGQVGEFSEPVTVATSRDAGPDPDTSNPTATSRPDKPTGLRVDVYYHDVELFWDRNNSGAVDKYEIRKDGELVATTRGTSWYDNTTQGGESYQFDVVAVGSNNDILGIPAECN